MAGGSIAGGTTVDDQRRRLDGFQPGTAPEVYFGGVPATDTQVISQNSIAAISPMEAAGTVDVSVTNANGTTDITPQDQFVFAAIPNVSAVSPPTGSIASPTQVYDQRYRPGLRLKRRFRR